jgi:hypothetical protein
MAYPDFTLRTLKERFGITATNADNLFLDMPPLLVSDFFRTLLKRCSVQYPRRRTTRSDLRHSHQRHELALSAPARFVRLRVSCAYAD